MLCNTFVKTTLTCENELKHYNGQRKKEHATFIILFDHRVLKLFKKHVILRSYKYNSGVNNFPCIPLATATMWFIYYRPYLFVAQVVLSCSLNMLWVLLLSGLLSVTMVLLLVSLLWYGHTDDLDDYRPPI